MVVVAGSTLGVGRPRHLGPLFDSKVVVALIVILFDDEQSLSLRSCQAKGVQNSCPINVRLGFGDLETHKRESVEFHAPNAGGCIPGGCPSLATSDCLMG